MRIIVAIDKNGVIGNNNNLPWRIKEDLLHFKGTTEGGTVIMGANTFVSLGERPLPNRINIVIDRRVDGFEHRFGNLFYVESLQFLVGSLGAAVKNTDQFIIGGGKTYEEALNIGCVDELIVTHVNLEVPGDTYFKIPDGWVCLGNRELSERATVKYYKKGN